MGLAMVRFLCPFCRFALEAPQARRSTPILCPGCQRLFKVPSGRRKPACRIGAAPTVPGEDTVILAELDEGEPAVSGTSGVAVGAGAALVVLALVAYLLIRSGLLWRLVLAPLQDLLHGLGLPGWLAPLAAIGLLILAVVLIGVPLFARWMKSTVLQKMPTRLAFDPAEPGEFPALDTQAFNGYTHALEDLGFRHAFDYRLRNELADSGTGFARLFLHPEHGCYAEINQAFGTGGVTTKMGCTLLSVLDDGWSLSSTDRDPAAFAVAWLWREPRVLWTAHPGAAPEKLLKAHLARRDRLARTLGLEIASDLSADAYFARESDVSASRRRALQRKSAVVGLFEYWQWRRNPRHEWLGEYRRQHPKRRRG